VFCAFRIINGANTKNSIYNSDFLIVVFLGIHFIRQTYKKN
jgi:hypothetical protein